MRIDSLRDKEVSTLKDELRRTVRLCKAIYAESDSIMLIKEALASEDVIFAKQIWDELDLETQKLLTIAPSKGSPFTTSERAQITAFWTQVGI